MTLRDKTPYIISTLLIFITSAFILSKNTSFSGDEFYTLDIERIHKPLTYKIVVSGLINFLKPTSSDNVFALRLSSIIFSIISIMLWFIYYIKNTKQALIFSFLIITNGFLLKESIFFRYYSFYFLTSSITFFVLLYVQKLKSVNHKLLISFLGLTISPYILFILNGMQYLCYFVYVFIFEKIKDIRLRIVLIGMIGCIIFSTIVFPKTIWRVFNWLNIMEHAIIDLSSTQVRGFTLSTFVKPFYAIYQMIFGYEIVPTESIIVVSLFILISIVFLHILFKIYKRKDSMIFFYISIFIIPFLLIFYFFETITLPGFLQMDTRHGMLLYPFILSLILLSVDYLSDILKKIFIFSIIFSQIIGVVNAHTIHKSNWSIIANKIDYYVKEKKCNNILIDGRSTEQFKFYNTNQSTNKLIKHTWEKSDSIESWYRGSQNITLLLNDYKSYTNLSLKQNWNAGTDSYSRVETLDLLLEELNREYYLVDSYINYPTFLYFFEKKNGIDLNIISCGVWKHHLKDLVLPIPNNKESQIVSSVIIKPKESINILSDSLVILNLENSNQIDLGEIVGLVKTDIDTIELIKGINILDIFSEFYGETPEIDNIYYEWYHKPLVSGSISYPGSYFKHKARLYAIKLNVSKESNIYISNLNDKLNIRVWLLNHSSKSYKLN